MGGDGKPCGGQWPVTRPGDGGLCNAVRAHNPKGGSVEIYCHGAHLTSWQTADGEELLFVSKQAVFQPGKAIRGGVPVCLPQFAALGPLQQHGFARNVDWTPDPAGGGGAAALALQATPDVGGRFGFDGAFAARMTARVDDSGALEQRLQVTNTGRAPLPLTAALHTYFAVSDAAQSRVEGLQGCRYVDKVDGGAAKVEQGAAVAFSGEVDRIYEAVPGAVRLVDPGRGRAVVVEMSGGFKDAIVWNPGADKARAMADFGDDEYKSMVCIEAAVASSGPVTLAPGETWEGQQRCSLQPL